MMNTAQWFQFQEMLTPSYATNESFQAMKNFYLSNGIGTDWAKEYLGNTAPITQIDASVRGGSQNMTYLVSFSHYDADGLYDDSSLRRETLRTNLEANITPWLKIGSNTNLGYTKTHTTLWASDVTNLHNKSVAAHVYLPTQTTHEILGLVYLPNGSIDYANSTFEGYGDELKYYSLMNCFNPDYLSDIQPASNDRVRINENAFVNINPIKGLNIRSAVGLDWNMLRVSNKSYSTLPDGFSDLSNGSVTEQASTSYRWTVTNTAEYKFDILRDHHVSVLLGQESMNNKTSLFGVQAGGITDNRLMTLSSAPLSGVSALLQTITEQVRNSWFGMLNYSYADRYFLDLSIRRDGSSLFAEDHRWGTFGAAALMWNITNEKFMLKSRKWLNDLQVRLSYGTTGNSGIDPYMAVATVGNNGSYNNTPATSVINPGNPDLTWETVKTFNVGLSGRLFNRVDFDFQYYHKTTSDMLMQIPYSYTTGFTSGWGNVAEMTNQGFDFNVSVDIIKTKDWYWNVKVNGNYNKNKITKLFQGLDEFVYGDFAKLEIGHPYGEFYMVRWDHVDPVDGQSVWLDKDGNYTKVYSEADKVQTGKNSIAPWSAGLSTTVAWKGLQLDVQFSGMFDRYMYNNERYMLENPLNASTTNMTENMLNMWMEPGDITDVPAANCTRQLDTQFLENASFVRLKFLQLSYTLPEKWMQATHFIKGVKVFFTGRNLLTFTKYTGYDPEVSSMITIGDYPNTRQYSFGAQITF